MTRLGIYGGTFSPIHCGHVRAAYAFLDAMQLDRLLVIPSAIPPHKAEVEGASAWQRLEMARLAFMGGDPRLRVSDYEIKRMGKSYTLFTLEHFSAPDTELMLLVGTDMFLSLEHWYRAEDIFQLADIVLMRRECDRQNDLPILAKFKEYREKYGARLHEIPESPIVVSSTELRERLRVGASTADLLPESVAAYIQKNRLYQPNIDEKTYQ